MTDRVVDTNVFLAASGKADHLLANDSKTVLDWLDTFRKNRESKLVLDTLHLIRSEYFRKLSDQDFGYQVLREELECARFVEIKIDDRGSVVLPKDLVAAVQDPDDHKFVGVALADGGGSPIVNACDGDWFDCEAALCRFGIKVEHLLPHLRPLDSPGQ